MKGTILSMTIAFLAALAVLSGSTGCKGWTCPCRLEVGGEVRSSLPIPGVTGEDGATTYGAGSDCYETNGVTVCGAVKMVCTCNPPDHATSAISTTTALIERAATKTTDVSGPDDALPAQSTSRSEARPRRSGNRRRMRRAFYLSTEQRDDIKTAGRRVIHAISRPFVAAHTLASQAVDRMRAALNGQDAAAVVRPAAKVSSPSFNMQRYLDDCKLCEGVTYDYGAKADDPMNYWPPERIDCSGATKGLLARQGITIPHGSANQRAHAQSIPKESLQPCDLVFAHRTDGTVHHVAAYVADGILFEAPADGIPCRFLDVDTFIARYARKGETVSFGRA